MNTPDREVRDAEIVRLYEGGMLAREVADRIGLSRPRILQILAKAGVETRGRRKVLTADDCERSFQAAVADGVTTVWRYMEWNRRNPWAVSVGTLRNRGYEFSAIPNYDRRPFAASDVTMPDLREAPDRPAAGRWLYINGCESAKAIQVALGGRINMPSLAARPRGFPYWSLSYLDSILPDQTCGEGR